MSRGNSSKRQHRVKPKAPVTVTCSQSGGKIRYRSRKRALTAMNKTRALADHSAPNGVYQCPHCRDWHMTSKAAA